MKPQILGNPYKRIEAMERTLKAIETWARVDITNRADKVKRSMPACLRAEDVVGLIGKVLG